MSSARLHDLQFDHLQERLTGEPKFRTAQIWIGAYQQLALSYEEISTLPIGLRQHLEKILPFTACDIVDERRTADGSTVKRLHRLDDGQTVESVVMLYPKRATVCVSSQVGCAVGCPFCATGRGGFVRDLSPGEIVVQVLHAAREAQARGRTLSNTVYMGMGEPFLNYDAVLTSVRILNDPRGFGLGARSFTLSTAGIVPGIDRLATENLQANLAVSLHTVDDELRTRLVPINRRHPVEELLRACRRYTERTHRRVSFEVALLEGVNDSQGQAKALASRLAGTLSHVNLIPYNATTEILRASPADRIQAYAGELERAGVPVSIRHSMGGEIEAGCGQLRARRTEC